VAHQTVRHWDTDLVPTPDGRTDAPEESCPVEAALKVISGRWSTLIIRELLHGPLSFSEFRTVLPTLSDKVLSERLAFLTEQRVVDREVTPGFPATVTYRLTPGGEALRPLMIALYQTGEALLADGEGRAT
jgi:DNA-binding HxlR family transcriptional regulator